MSSTENQNEPAHTSTKKRSAFTRAAAAAKTLKQKLYYYVNYASFATAYLIYIGKQDRLLDLFKFLLLSVHPKADLYFFYISFAIVALILTSTALSEFKKAILIMNKIRKELSENKELRELMENDKSDQERIINLTIESLKVITNEKNLNVPSKELESYIRFLVPKIKAIKNFKKFTKANFMKLFRPLQILTSRKKKVEESRRSDS